MPPALITIGVTVYNAASTIQQALLSALAQDYPSVEILVVDDHSDDASPAIVEALARKYPSISLVRQPENRGVAHARNVLIERSAGEFLAFFDDDDLSAPDRLSRQYERLVSYERVHGREFPILCHTARVQCFPDGTERFEPTIGTDPCVAAPSGLAVVRHILSNQRVHGRIGSMATCSQMARRSVYVGVGGFDPLFRRVEDTDFCLRVAAADGHFVGIDIPLVRQLMTATPEKSLETERFYTIRLYDKHRDLYADPHDFVFDRQWIDIKYSFLQRRWAHFIAHVTRLLVCHPAKTVARLFRASANVHYNVMFGRFLRCREP
ncbi:MAG: glycosyltransferase [Spartobacteria bacterium]|nr:glycosyltransferase [Spartobacteria bacterium]